VTQALAPDPFAPLSLAEAEAVPPELGADKDEVTPVIPVPEDAPAAQFRHFELGEPSATWMYKDETGRLLGHVARFETASGKQVIPRTWCRLPDGTHAWRWRAFSAPRPLYGLDRLAGRPDAIVLVVEGEKTADAAQLHFPDHVAVTWPGGSNTAGKADWSVLAGRSVVVWPDADGPGRKAAEDVAKLAARARPASVSEVVLPHGLPAGWDLADPVPGDLCIADLLASARLCAPEVELPPGYSMKGHGLVWRDPGDKEKPELWLAGPFQVLAETRDGDGKSWGVLLQWHDHDDRQHRLAIPRSMLAGDGADARRALLDGGLYVAPTRGARERLTAFLTVVRSSARMTATGRIGWHGSAFVLPDRCVGASYGEELLLQGTGAVEHAFRERGTLQEWQNEIACYGVGNSRLAVALSTAFAAALIGPCEVESGGLHLRGASSIGKSTALAVAGSVWGGGEPGGYVRSWRATANGLEGVALGHCDALLCLDELAQISARDAGEVAYMLANGAGKSRSARDGSARRAARWRVLFLSSGEIGLADKVAEDGRGKRLAAGQQVRIVDILADPGAGLGLFEELHRFSSAEALATHLRASAASIYGSAAGRFLSNVAGDLDGIRSTVSEHTRTFVERYVPAGADGQVHRVAQRFALIAAAGELAVAAEVLPWPAGEATKAAARVYRDWLDARGGVEPAEISTGITQVRSFLLAHGMARFVPAWEEPVEPRIPPRDIAGYRKREGEGWDYYITTSAWHDEVCRGLDSRALASQLAERGMLLIPTSGPHRAKSIKVPGHNKCRLYHIPACFLEADRDD
jgi:putative DNA primase/helicase